MRARRGRIVTLADANAKQEEMERFARVTVCVVAQRNTDEDNVAVAGSRWVVFSNEFPIHSFLEGTLRGELFASTTNLTSVKSFFSRVRTQQQSQQQQDEVIMLFVVFMVHQASARGAARRDGYGHWRKAM